MPDLSSIWIDAFNNKDFNKLTDLIGQTCDELITNLTKANLSKIQTIIKEQNDIRDIVNKSIRINRDTDYYYGIMYAITYAFSRLTVHINNLDKDTSLINKKKYLKTILNYLMQNGTTQHKELAEYLDISASGLSNLFCDNEVIQSGLIRVENVGKSTWYSLSVSGREKCKEIFSKETDSVESMNEKINKAYRYYLDGDYDVNDLILKTLINKFIEIDNQNKIRLQTLELKYNKLKLSVSKEQRQTKFRRDYPSHFEEYYKAS